MLARHHAAAHRVRATEQTCRADEIARVERRPDAGTADAGGIRRHGGDHLDLETELRPRLAQEVGVGRAATTEVEVVAHDDTPRLQTLGEQAHERIAVHAAQPGVEAQQHEGIEAAAREQPHALAEVGEPRRRLGGRQELPRQRLEGEHHRRARTLRHPGPARLRDGRVDQRAMTEMQPVEAADRDDAALMARREIMDAAHEFHQRPSPARRCAGRSPASHSTAA